MNPTSAGHRPPSISREMFESIVRNPVLLPNEKAYVINRAVGEYSAFSVIDHLRAVEESQRAVAREEPGEPWSSIDDRTRTRYRDLIRVLDEVSKGEESFKSFMTWNWITLRALDSFREASRESDDALERITGGPRGRDASNESAWDMYRGRFMAENLRSIDRDRVKAADVDRYTLSLGSSIRSRYGRELSASTPFMNEYIDAACLMELSQMHTMMDNFGRAIDPVYMPSPEVELSAQRSVLSVGGIELLPEQAWRPSRDDIIEALQDGTFDELLDRTVMPDDEFDELMSETMDQYVEEHVGLETVDTTVIDFMDRAEQSTGRAIHWQNGAAQTRLREAQEWRDQQLVSAESTSEHLVAVPLDEQGLPEMSMAYSPEAPVTVETAMDEPELVPSSSGRSREDEELIESLEHSHYLDEDEAADVEAMFDAGDADRAREILEERAEEAERAADERAVREVEDDVRDALELELATHLMIEATSEKVGVKDVVSERQVEPDFG